jgi:hypothetical protein
MLLFRSEEHVDRWCSQWSFARGAVLTPERAWALAHAWYSPDRRAPAWRRRTADETTAVLESLGLVGDFWRLT